MLRGLRAICRLVGFGGVGVLGSGRTARAAQKSRACAPSIPRAVPADTSSDGFAAIDALVALMILATTIVLALGAAETARRASARASETRHAVALLRGLLATAPHHLGSAGGRLAGFDWRIETRVAVVATPVASVRVCERQADARSVTSKRRYALSTTELCPSQAAAS